jgi:hypothetical protein
MWNKSKKFHSDTFDPHRLQGARHAQQLPSDSYLMTPDNKFTKVIGKTGMSLLMARSQCIITANDV